jgi:hypothetical protein
MDGWLLETCRSHRAVAGGLGKGMGEKFTTQRATKIAARGFSVDAFSKLAKELTNQDSL